MSPPTLDEYVREDHAAVRSTIERFHASRNSHRSEAFDELRAQLIAHEVAEEVVVLSALASVDPALHGRCTARMQDRSLAPTLAALGRLGAEDWRFDSLFAELERRFDAHADTEETMVLPALSSSLDADELRELGRRYVSTRDRKGARRGVADQDLVPADATDVDAVEAHDAIAVTMQRGAL